MNPKNQSSETIRRESIDSVLANNLLIARIVRKLTQHELASTANISRATIAQLETGYSDPRLSTVIELANGLGIPPLLLLLGRQEILVLSELSERLAANHTTIPDLDVLRMKEFLESGLLKDRMQAARIGAVIAGELGATDSACVSAAIFSAIHPGPGTVAGKLLGELLSQP